MAGAAMPLLARGGQLTGTKVSDGIAGAEAGGRTVELREGCGEVTALSQTIENVRRLVEEEHVDVVVAPMLGQAEGIVMRDFARRYPDVAFLIANSRPRSPRFATRLRISSASSATGPSRSAGSAPTPITTSVATGGGGTPRLGVHLAAGRRVRRRVLLAGRAGDPGDLARRRGRRRRASGAA